MKIIFSSYGYTSNQNDALVTFYRVLTKTITAIIIRQNRGKIS